MIWATGPFFWLDPSVSVAIAVLIAIDAYPEVRQAADVLLESTAKGLDFCELSGANVAVDGVDTVHDLHVWRNDLGAVVRRKGDRRHTVRKIKPGRMQSRPWELFVKMDECLSR